MSEESSKKSLLSLFKKKNSSTVPLDFDETTFNFELKGEPVNSTIIQACATLKSSHVPLPLSCTWYRSTSEQEFAMIEGITGAFYQTSADDIGCKISVHAVPVSEVEEFTGMPVFREIGPIGTSEETSIAVQEMLDARKGTFSVLLDGDRTELTLDGDRICLGTYEGHLDSEEPKVTLQDRIENAIELEFKERNFTVIAERPALRDILVIFIRTLSGMAIVGHSEAYLRIERLSTRLQATNKEYKALLASYHSTQEELEKRKLTMSILAKTVKEKTDENSELQGHIEGLSRQYEEAQIDLQFLRQDTAVYKAQNQKLELQVLQLNPNSESLALKRFHEQLAFLTDNELCEHCKGARTLCELLGELAGQEPASSTASVHSEEPTRITETYESKIRKLRKKVFAAKQRIAEQELSISESQDKSLAEKNHFKAKIESLTIENNRLLSRLGRNPRELSEFAREKEEFLTAKEQLFKQVEEAELRAQSFAELLALNKQKIEDEMNTNFELRKIRDHGKILANEDYRRIINSLTETLATREEELKTQKELNESLAGSTVS